jgi:hypothetical protein
VGFGAGTCLFIKLDDYLSELLLGTAIGGGLVRAIF